MLRCFKSLRVIGVAHTQVFPNKAKFFFHGPLTANAVFVLVCSVLAVLLCKVINAVQPGLIPRINKAGSFLSETENIEAFLSACCTLGVAEHSLFKAEDLLEKRDLQVVVRALNILGATVQATVPCFRGPFLGEGTNFCLSHAHVYRV